MCKCQAFRCVHMLSCSPSHGCVWATSPCAHMHWASATLLTDVLHACVPPPLAPTCTNMHPCSPHVPTFACLIAACGLHSHAPTRICSLWPSHLQLALEHTHGRKAHEHTYGRKLMSIHMVESWMSIAIHTMHHQIPPDVQLEKGIIPAMALFDCGPLDVHE